MNITLSQKQYAINSIFKGSIYGYDKPENEAISLAGIHADSFLNDVKNEYPDAKFDSQKNENATTIDSLRLYEVVKYPGDPDIQIKITLYQNTPTSYFLELIR
ncbi:hypothetical protein K5I29_12560 [Flavobacterium agricola]|uniref:Uncharacterized protein n=1 Tax=Flavobacterium agricola TaxID=2870839 RepID=A0ABY6LY50_9FLAO|nr:hypothetical protein [Flavobacterium agricola]UYW01263.1 hypothetical protein K5I29_12560 [Flavobacterium agricola]